MSNKGARNLFIFGSIFFFLVFLALTFDTMKQIDARSPAITEAVDEGKQLWHKYDCIGCHTIFGNGSYFAPDLTKVTRDKPSGYLKTFLVNPRKANPNSAMPVLGITQAEAEKLVAFLEWTSKVDTNGWPPEPVLAAMRKAQTGGIAVYQKHGCASCHIIGGVGGTSGPDLTKTGARHSSPDWHISHLKNPAGTVQGSAMPAYEHLTEDEMKLLGEYLTSLK